MATGNRHNTVRLPTRNTYIDLLRIVATFGVIMLHTSASKWYDTPVNSFNWQIMNMYDSLVRWNVPIFIMISGVFHLRPNKSDVNFKDELGTIYKKVFRIVCAIIFWGVLYNSLNLAGKYFIKNEPITLYKIIRIPGLLILGPAYYHLWFLYMLIGLYLLTPVFRCFMNNCKRQHIEYVLFLFFIVGTCFPFMNGILNNFSVFNGKSIYFPVAELTGYIGYYIAGYYFSNYELRKNVKASIYILAVLSLLFTIIGTAFISIYRKEPVSITWVFVTTYYVRILWCVFVFQRNIWKNKIFR